MNIFIVCPDKRNLRSAPSLSHLVSQPTLLQLVVFFLRQLVVFGSVQDMNKVGYSTLSNIWFRDIGKESSPKGNIFPRLGPTSFFPLQHCESLLARPRLCITTTDRACVSTGGTPLLRVVAPMESKARKRGPWREKGDHGGWAETESVGLELGCSHGCG
jgi:hypothetical protein